MIMSKTEASIYAKVLAFGLVIFGGLYAYTSWMGTPNVMNKSVADASIVLIGLSMWLSSLSYFLNIFDPLIKYRKHLGLIGFAFGVVHIGLSFSALLRLFDPVVWQQGAMWPALTGLLATIIFTIMTLISNRLMMTKLGVMLWRGILRMGYIAVALVSAHVILLKSARWMTWFEGGMNTLPSTSLMVTVFMAVVILMRLVMWIRIATTSRK
jgi:DMSO/TMAO reductase YedYZ heme-binding membrane subunit